MNLNQYRRYEVKNKLLYKKNRKDPDKPIRVIKWTEVEPILYMMHSHPTAGHMLYIIRSLNDIIGTKCIEMFRIMFALVKYARNEAKVKERNLSTLSKLEEPLNVLE